MTRKEAIKQLEINKKDDTYVIDDEALDMAIKALQEEPCEDAVSRQAVLDLVNSDWKYEGLEEPIENLPPVTPLSKGHGKLADADKIINSLKGIEGYGGM